MTLASTPVSISLHQLVTRKFDNVSYFTISHLALPKKGLGLSHDVSVIVDLYSASSLN